MAAPRLPPRWFIRLFWFAHRRLYRLTRGHLGLWRPKPNGWGAMRLNTVGRRTGLERSVIVGYFEDGPDVRINLPDGTHLVTGRATRGEERDRLWSRWREIDKNLDAYAARRSMETAVVVLERRS